MKRILLTALGFAQKDKLSRVAVEELKTFYKETINKQTEEVVLKKV